MKDFILTLLLLLSYAAAYADEVTFSITEGDRVEINAQIDGMKQYIKEGYDYEAAGDTEFGATVVSFLKRAETYLERKILVDKAEVFYREASPVGSSGLSTLDELVKGDLGYSGTDVDKEIEGIARVFKYEVYSVLMSKNGFEASPYAGWKKNFVDVIDDGKVIETSEIPNEIEKLSSQLIEIRDKALKDAENSIKKVKELISLKSANYVEQSEIEMKPLKSYSSPYRKEEVMRYAMAVNMEFKYRVIAAELKEKIASLEWIKLNPGTSKSEIANTKHKLKAYKKYVFRYKMQTPINILYRTGKEVESSIYMMVALGIQDIAFYKFPNVFLTEENAAFYEQFTNATFTQYMKDRFGSWAPYKSFGAFVATSHLIRALPAPSFILKISKWADSKLWGVGGTRIRGLALFSISMAAASKVSEAVSLYDNFNGELNFDSSGLDFISDDPDLSNVQSELSALANSYISKSLYYSFSDFMVSTGNFLTSFALSEMILKQINGRLIPWGYYGVKSKLNKTRCRALLNTITTALKNTPKAIKYTGNVFKTIFMDAAPMFLLASFIDKWMEVGESYFIDNGPKQKEMADIYLKLQKLEYELLGTGIKAYLDEPQERLAMYDKLDDLSLIEDIVEYLRDNDTWVVGTIKKKFDDQSKTMVERNADVDEFITQVFDAISSSKINTTQLALLETQYNSNIGYKEVTADIYSEENYTQLVNSSKEQLDFISENGDSVIKGLGELDPNIPAMAKQINQERLFNEQKFFTNIRQGIWGAEEKLLLVELTKERYPDDYQVYVDFYTGIIDSAYNYSGTPDKKIANMFKNIYPKFVEAPLMVKNDYAEFAYFGEDLLDALVFSIYSSFMKGVNTLSSDSDKYWSYMDNIVVAAVGIGLSGDDSYSYRTFNYMGLTLFTILSAPLTTAEWSSFKVWKEDAANINKTYKDFAYENWKLKNPGKGNASFDEFYAEVWRSWVASDVAKISEEDAKDAYGIWKNRRKNRGF